MNRCVSVLLTCLVCWLAFAIPAAAEDPAPVAVASPPVEHTGTFLFLPRGNRWIAATLSLGLNGLGQLYNEDPQKGFGMMAAWLSFPLAYGFDALTGRAYGRIFSYAVNLGVKTWSVGDAFNNAAPYPSPSVSATPAQSDTPATNASAVPSFLPSPP